MDKDSATEGVALIGYGSSKPHNREAVMNGINILRKEGVRNTYHAFIGREGPTVQEMMDTAAKDGIQKLIVIPYLVATGEMTLKYIPERLGISGRYGEHEIESPAKMTIEYVRPVGESPRIAEMFDDMIKRSPAGKGKKGYLLISHGSKVGYRSDLPIINKDRLEKLGYRDIYVSYVEFQEPNISDTAEKMVKDGVRHIIAIPMLLASGLHMKEDIPASLGLKEGMTKGVARIWDRDIRIDITQPFGKHPMMKDVLMDILENY